MIHLSLVRAVIPAVLLVMDLHHQTAFHAIIHFFTIKVQIAIHVPLENLVLTTDLL